MNNYISIKEVMDNLLSHPLLQDLSFERVVNYAIQFERIVGMPPIFIEKVDTIDIIKWRGYLPCDLFEINQVRDCYSKTPYRYATGNFHMNQDRKYPELTYKIQGGIIYTSVEDTKLEISYQALPLDEEGFPMIPDKSSFIRALELFIKKQWFTVLFDLGKISQAVLQNTQQEYAWAVGQCQSDLIRPTVDQMESLSHMWNTLIQRNNEHNNSFDHLGTKEHLKF